MNKPVYLGQAILIKQDVNASVPVRLHEVKVWKLGKAILYGRRQFCV